MTWRGTNPIRCFDAQDDHIAQPLLTHSDRTASWTGAIPVRPTEDKEVPASDLDAGVGVKRD